MKQIDGGVTAAKGFKAASTAAGIKYKDRKDMAMIYSEVPCKAAGTFTTNIRSLWKIPHAPRQLLSMRASPMPVQERKGFVTVWKQQKRRRIAFLSLSVPYWWLPPV